MYAPARPLNRSALLDSARHRVARVAHGLDGRAAGDGAAVASPMAASPLGAPLDTDPSGPPAYRCGHSRTYYHRARAHLSLEQDAPTPRRMHARRAVAWWCSPKLADFTTGTSGGRLDAMRARSGMVQSVRRGVGEAADSATANVSDTPSSARARTGTLITRHADTQIPRNVAGSEVLRYEKREPLPPLEPGQRATIVIERQQNTKPIEPVEALPVPPEIAFERDPVGPRFRSRCVFETRSCLCGYRTASRQKVV